MDTQTGAATGLFGLSLDTLKLSSADYTQLCGLWVGRVQFLSDRYRLEWEAASLEQALAAIAQRDGGIHCNQTMLLLHALARTLRWRCDIHASALRHLARE